MVADVRRLEAELTRDSDQELRERYLATRAAHRSGERRSACEAMAMALTCEAVRRHLGFELRDVQLLTAIALAEGQVAQMRTGEGKTLAALPALVRLSLSFDTLHVATANPYLAARDAREMAPVLEMIGLSASALTPELSDRDERRRRYRADVCYGTLSEFAFDYLRDNLAMDASELLQGDLGFLLIDEADSVLIDEAKTPMVIAGASSGSADLSLRMAAFVSGLSEGEHYLSDAPLMHVQPLESGVAALEEAFDLVDAYSPENLRLVNAYHQALRANALYRRDRDYLIADRQVKLIDPNTGRVTEGRSWADGLQQAVEAKEAVPISAESLNLAEITVQSFVRLYRGLGGMTGTASTDAEEFERVYGLPVLEVPTHRPVARKDRGDRIYRSQEARAAAVVAATTEAITDGRAVLIGTPSVAMSETISMALAAADISHSVLNAKDPASEAETISRAGDEGAVMVATNMAGRGVDIIVAPEVLERGGLLVIGTSRHAARRTDDQLIGRSGRQGQPGESMFLIAADDELVADFAGDRVRKLLSALPGEPGDPIENAALTRAVRSSQETAERRDAEARSELFMFDEPLHHQRLVWFSLRRSLLAADEPEVLLGDWLAQEARQRLLAGHQEMAGRSLTGDPAAVAERVRAKWLGEASLAPALYRALSRRIALAQMDRLWREHVDLMRSLRSVVHLRGSAGRQPVVEYGRAAARAFEELEAQLRSAICDEVPRIRLYEQPVANRSQGEPQREQ